MITKEDICDVSEDTGYSVYDERRYKYTLNLDKLVDVINNL